MCVQLRLEEDIKYLREEMMKTETLQAKEEQTLTEWQVGAQWLLVPPCVPIPILIRDRKCHPGLPVSPVGGLQGGKRSLYSAGLVPDLQTEPTQDDR